MPNQRIMVMAAIRYLLILEAMTVEKNSKITEKMIGSRNQWRQRHLLMGLCNCIVLIFHRLGYHQLAWTCEIVVGTREKSSENWRESFLFRPLSNNWETETGYVSQRLLFLTCVTKNWGYILFVQKHFYCAPSIFHSYWCFLCYLHQKKKKTGYPKSPCFNTDAALHRVTDCE